MLRYLYNEMSAEESMVFLKFINSSPAVREQFNHMKEGFETLNSISLNPSRIHRWFLHAIILLLFPLLKLQAYGG